MKRAGRRSLSSYNRFGRSRSRRPVWRRLVAPLVMMLVLIAIGALAVRWLDIDAATTAPQLAAANDAPLAAPAERTAKLAPLTLPADDSAHGSAMEWWYYSGILDGQADQRWAFHVAVFVVNGLIKHTVMHAALTDLASGRRYTAQSRTGGLPAKPERGGFDFRATGWSLTGSGPAHQLRFEDIGGRRLSLDLLDPRPVVAHRASGSNTPGLLDFGDSGISYYYSRPRMQAKGSVRSDGRELAVQGVVWFDHQWGEFDVGRLGWSWFAIHLGDGSDLMVYQLFDRQGRSVMSTGTTVRPDGTARPLAPGELVLEPVRRWTSPRTGVEYTLGWQLKVPWGAFEVDAMHDDSEFDAGLSSANLYWEGPVSVRGAQQGEGFLELSGYEHLKPRRTP